ncbi:choice-of-anchor X domain-containing protein [Candidatus Thiodictyon syntrophicum]|jgi:hypothetical protein|uniref:VWFA domain-containing protein n=1 Tax=Candidatus Thiodictyon syntrophicum TaxID=1166950 RepID=A0A2K8U6P9_9GAMM|nr:choice-of-anchor X domain-containing protein [Candidatus Thiodictyon syntrophicum]AUB81234.1 hypothetical protein THSYN_09900 [Candidatus Thiodictyon syntrophicum]
MALVCGAPLAQAAAVAQVVVIVDTSTSMAATNMDPHQVSLLVTGLLADIVPGAFAVVRLLDVGEDSRLIPSRKTGERVRCSESPNGQCQRVEAQGDWETLARQGRLGVLERGARADRRFRGALPEHLKQKANNSMFALAFRAARGVFDQLDAGPPRTVIWLSDGQDDNPDRVRAAIGELKADGVAIEAVLFGQGDAALARGAGLEPRVVPTPADLMRAFAAALRTALRAPYAIDARVQEQPVFRILDGAEQVWVVAYGDDSLKGATLTGPGGTVVADYAAAMLPKAGAYRVAYLERPAAGDWRIAVQGGGAAAAYAVIQFADLTPVLLSPTGAMAGTPALVEAQVRIGGAAGTPALAAQLTSTRLTLEAEGQSVGLNDAGRDGDRVAGDGRFGALVTFPRAGVQPVTLHLDSPLARRSVSGQLEVGGALRFGAPVDLDLGTLGLAAEACRPLPIAPTMHAGEVPVQLAALRALPADHRLALRLPTGELEPGGGALPFAPGAAAILCLRTGPRAPHSVALGEPWLELRAAGTHGEPLTIRLRWQVQGLGFLARWGWLLALLAAALVLALIVAGFMVPKRFRPTLGLVFVETREELDEVQPLSIRRQWRGVGAGFYRDARAYLHGNYRLSGRAAGALACLKAEARYPRALPVAQQLYRESAEGDWEEVAPQGYPARPGFDFRIGERGPYFRLSNMSR